MLTAFVFVAAVLAFVMQRPRWQRITMLAASVPIAVVSNAVRVVATAIYACFVNSAERVEPFHDIAGLLMMPFGLALSLGLLALLDRLVVKDAPEISHVSGRRNGSSSRPADRPRRTSMRTHRAR
jgi:exosortase/archaeosortase family protein